MAAWTDREASTLARACVPVIVALGLAGCGGTAGSGPPGEFDSHAEPPADPRRTLDTVSVWEAMFDDWVFPQGPEEDGTALPGPSDHKTYGPFQEDFTGAQESEMPLRPAFSLMYRGIPDARYPDLWRVEGLLEFDFLPEGWLGIGFYGGTGLGRGTVEDAPTKIRFDLGLTLRYRAYLGNRASAGGTYLLIGGDLGAQGTDKASDRQECSTASLYGGLGWEFAAGRETRMGVHARVAHRWLYPQQDGESVPSGFERPAWEVGVGWSVFFPAR